MAIKGKSKKNLPSPLVASMDCSGLKSLYRSCRSHFLCSELSDHHLPANPTPRRTKPLSEPTLHQHPSSSVSCEGIEDSTVAANMYWKRARQLELELAELDHWLNTEKRLRDDLNNAIGQYQSRAGTGLMKLAQGGYIHHLNVPALGRPGWNLAMQVSEPAIFLVETGSDFPKVLNQMSAMGRENLMQWLLESLPMCDISGSEMDARPVAQCSEEGFLEAMLLNAVEKLEKLALEGMEVQMGGRGKAEKEWGGKKSEQERDGECLTEVMLIQMRYSNKEYEVAGEMMIGFVEACVAESEESGFLIRRVHVAGISARSSCQSSRGEYLWSISLRSSQEKYVRNSDIYLGFF